MNLMSSKNEIWRQLFLILFGQLLSFIVAVYCFANSYIAEMGVNMPFAQNTAIYLPLAVVYGPVILSRRQKLQVPWYFYAFVATADVHGNYLSTKAYQYTSITSVTLLYSWVIPWVIILTSLVLRTRYYLWQLLGAAICVVGLVLAVLSDAVGSGGDGTNWLLGDILVIAGTLCFALSNVGMEFCTKKNDQNELLSMLGVFGVLILLCEIPIFERKELIAIKWSPTLITMFAAYTATQFLGTVMCVALIKMSGATMLNLSLLTSNMWTALIRIFFYKKQVSWLYYVAVAFSATGLTIYSLSDAATPNTDTPKEDLEATIPYRLLPEENLTRRAEVLVN